MSVYKITEYGALGDGHANDAKALQNAIDACASAGGGMVLVPAGTFLCGSFRLKNNVNLHLENGARLIPSTRQEDFGPRQAMIYADGAHDIAITGFGQIDGCDKLFMAEELPYIWRPKAFRPGLIVLERCRQVTICDITIRNAPWWTLHPICCDDVAIRGIRILNDLKVPNCDGIDPDHCRNLRISDCLIEAGDDCICLKNEGDNKGPCENITVSGCVLVSTSAAIKFGSGTWGDFRSIMFDNCVIRRSSRGLGIQARDFGTIEDVLFNNITIETRLFDDHWWGKAEPIYVTCIHRLPGNRLGKVRNVRFANILCKGENGVFIAGSPDSPIEDISLDNVRIEIDKTTKWPGGKHDRRPCSPAGAAFTDKPGEDPGLTDHPTAGVYIQHARNVSLRNVDVVWGPNRPAYFGKAIETEDVKGLEKENFRDRR